MAELESAQDANEWINRKADQSVDGGIQEDEVIPGDGSVAEERSRSGDGCAGPVTEVDVARNDPAEDDPQAA
jgi:hypothetical protein